MVVDLGASGDDDSDGGSAQAMQVDPPSAMASDSSTRKDSGPSAVAARAETGFPSVDAVRPAAATAVAATAATAATVAAVTARTGSPTAARASRAPSARGSAADSVGFSSASSNVAKTNLGAMNATAQPAHASLDAAADGAAAHDDALNDDSDGDDATEVNAAAPARPRPWPKSDPPVAPFAVLDGRDGEAILAAETARFSALIEWCDELDQILSRTGGESGGKREGFGDMRRRVIQEGREYFQARLDKLQMIREDPGVGSSSGVALGVEDMEIRAKRVRDASGICPRVVRLDPEAFAAALKTKTAVKGLETPPDEEDPVVYLLGNTVVFAAFPRGLSEAATSSMETFRRLFLVSTVDSSPPAVCLKSLSRSISKGSPERSGELILGAGWTRFQIGQPSTAFLTESSIQKTVTAFQTVNDGFTQALHPAFKAQTKALDQLESDASQQVAYLVAMITSTSIGFAGRSLYHRRFGMFLNQTIKLHKDPDFSGYIWHHDQPVAVLPWGCLNAAMKVGAPSLVTVPALGFERRLGNGAVYFSRAAYLQHSAEAPGEGEGDHISCISYTSRRDVPWHY
ncbi:hypothetical protein HK405_010693 [Cladochytrium tenue]|nr:hypothetical protein HK405_010693 [Cladochytrium tenue]